MGLRNFFFRVLTGCAVGIVLVPKLLFALEDLPSGSSGLQPYFYLDINSGKKLVNLSSQNGSAAARDLLLLDDYSQGLKLQRWEYSNVAIGLVRHWHDPTILELASHFESGMGVTPLLRSEKFSSYLVKDLAAAAAIPSRPLPLLATDLDLWKSGESMLYGNSGGLVFMVGTSLGPLNAGATVLAEGKWNTYVEKIGEQSVQVRFSKEKLESVRVFTGFSVATVGLAQFGRSDDTFSYAFDLGIVEGREAYEDFIQGNILLAQRLEGGGAVRKIDAFRSQEQGYAVNAFLSLWGLLSYKWSSGQSYDVSVGKLYAENTQVEAHYGIYLRQNRNHTINRSYGTIEAFYGTALQLQKDAQTTEEYFGQYLWKSEDYASTRKRLLKSMQAIAFKTGLRDFILVDVPPAKRLGYTNVKLQLTFSQKSTSHLINTAAALSQDELVRQGLDFYTEYFRDGRDPYGICSGSSDTKECHRRNDAVTRDAAAAIWKSLQAMRKWRGINKKSFVQAYADFGRQITKNQFIFDFVLNLAGAGVEIQYTLEGERISRYVLNLVSSEQGQLQVTQAPSNSIWRPGQLLPTHWANQNESTITTSPSIKN